MTLANRQSLVALVHRIVGTFLNKYVRPCHTRMEMYVACCRILCCLLGSHIEYAPHALLKLELKAGQMDKQMQHITLHLPLDVVSIIMCGKRWLLCFILEMV